jgi:hypothetical protein
MMLVIFTRREANNIVHALARATLSNRTFNNTFGFIPDYIVTIIINEMP